MRTTKTKTKMKWRRKKKKRTSGSEAARGHRPAERRRNRVSAGEGDCRGNGIPRARLCAGGCQSRPACGSQESAGSPDQPARRIRVPRTRETGEIRRKGDDEGLSSGRKGNRHSRRGARG